MFHGVISPQISLNATVFFPEDIKSLFQFVQYLFTLFIRDKDGSHASVCDGVVLLTA